MSAIHLGLDVEDVEQSAEVRAVLLDRFADWMIAGERDGVEWPVAEALRFKGDYLDGALGRWRRGDLAEILTELFPRKVTADPAGVALVVPMLRLFLGWLDEGGLLSPDGDPLPLLLAELDRVEPDLPELMADDRRFGPAKALMSMMLADGVDVGDPDALQEWTDAFNAQLDGADGPDSAWGSALAAEEPLEGLVVAMGLLMDSVGCCAAVQELLDCIPEERLPALLDALWPVDHPEVEQLLDVVARHAPKPIAKAARTARHKHRSIARR